MLLQNAEVTRGQLRQQQQGRERFSLQAAELIGAAGNCLFSLLPHEEQLRQTGDWYDACAQATLRGNYAPLDEWIRRQACLAAEQHFELEDLLQLLRICRHAAIEVERWNEDVFSAVDDVTNEGLLAIRAKVPWDIPDTLNYRTQAKNAPAAPAEQGALEPAARTEMRTGERRASGRNRLALPIRVRGTTQNDQNEEITRTQSVSLRGLYFTSGVTYREGTTLQVTYPYWTHPGSINREYSARVARLDRLPDNLRGVAVEFLQNLRGRTAQRS